MFPRIAVALIPTRVPLGITATPYRLIWNEASSPFTESVTTLPSSKERKREEVQRLDAKIGHRQCTMSHAGFFLGDMATFHPFKVSEVIIRMFGAASLRL